MFDSRTTLRYPIDLPARMQIAETEISCKIRNLSVGGVFVRGPSLPEGTRVKLKFSAPYLEMFEAICVARWNTEEGTGLAFEALRAVDIYSLAKFIRHSSRPTQKLPTDAILRRPAT
jgi:hypothetical protein